MVAPSHQLGRRTNYSAPAISHQVLIANVSLKAQGLPFRPFMGMFRLIVFQYRNATSILVSERE
jgi:hypothetical protein